MSDLFLLNKAQMARISPHFPLAHGIPRVDDKRVVRDVHNRLKIVKDRIRSFSA
jgi:hypothetical protein